MKALHLLILVGTLVIGSSAAARHTVVEEPAPHRRPERHLSAEATPHQPRSFFGKLRRDFGPPGKDYLHVLGIRNLVILGAGGLLGLAIRASDDNVTSTLVQSQGADRSLRIGDGLGRWYTLVGSAAMLYGVGRLTNREGLGDLGRDLLRAELVAQSITHGIKGLTDRPRPDGTRGSFPSGHTSGAFAAATVLHRHYGWKAGMGAYAVASYVGISRVQDNRHFPSDVIFGAAIGIASGIASGRSIGIGHRRVEIEPFAAADGAGIGVVIHR